LSEPEGSGDSLIADKFVVTDMHRYLLECKPSRSLDILSQFPGFLKAGQASSRRSVRKSIYLISQKWERQVDIS
jgi:hypothetical protein